MSNTICRFIADDIRGSGRLYSYCLESTKSDLNWKPAAKGSGRSMLEQADECAKLNHAVAAIIRGEQPSMGEEPLITDPAKAPAMLQASANDLAETIGGIEDSKLDQMIALPFGTYPIKFAVGIANSNMIYHWGQANYIEVLDGDTEFRFPPEFANK